MRKKIFAFFLCALMAVGVTCSSASAVEWSTLDPDPGIMTPQYIYADRLVVGLTISGGKASVSGTITGYSDVTKITYTVSLQVKSGSSWSDVTSWSGSSTSTRATYSYSNSVSTGKTYRTKTVVTLYSGSSKETVTAYSSEKTA